MTQLNVTPASNRPVLAEWILVGLISVNLVWTTLGLGGYRPETMLVTGLLTSLTMMVHLLGRVWGRTEFRLHPIGWLFVPFLLYATGNVLWVTPVPWLGWHDWFLWANLLITFWVVLNGLHHRLSRVALLTVICCLALGATMLASYQRFVEPDWLMLGRTQADQFLSRSSGPFGIPNSLAAFFLLITPAIWVLVIRQRATVMQRVIFGYLGVCCVIGILLTVSRGGWAGLAGALILWPLLAGRSRWWKRLISMLGVVGGLVLAGWILYMISPVVRDRYTAMINESGEWTRPIMWRGAWQIFQEHPSVGGGAGSYNILFEKHRPMIYQMEPQWAHNDYLNTLSDYGVIGFILFFGVAGVIVFTGLFRRREEVPNEDRADAFNEPLFWQAIAIGMLAFAAQLFVDFHFKIPALGMLFAISSALLIQRVWSPDKRPLKKPTHLEKLVIPIVVLGLGWGTAFNFYPMYRAESLRYSARQAMDKLWQLEATDDIYRTTLDSARQSLRQATKINVKSAQAWADLSWATALWGHIEPDKAAALGREAADYAARALAISEVVPEFWIRKSVGNDMRGKWLEAGGNMSKAMQLAPANASVWFYQGFHLSLRAASKAQSRAALDYCLRLDPSNRTAQRLRQQLALDSVSTNP